MDPIFAFRRSHSQKQLLNLPESGVGHWKRVGGHIEADQTRDKSLGIGVRTSTNSETGCLSSLVFPCVKWGQKEYIPQGIAYREN